MSHDALILIEPVAGNVGPFGFDPLFEVNGGWPGWADRLCARIVRLQVCRLCIWLPRGNTDPRGWRLLPQPCGGEIFDKTRPQQGDKIVFDAQLYQDPISCDSFERAVADKQDDGIIQNNVVGRKRRGVLDREYTVPTTGAAVTEW